MSRIFVTGMGVISAIGDSVSGNHLSLVQGKCGIGRLELLPSKYADVLPFGEIKITTDTLKEKLKVHASGITRTSLLAMHAFKEAVDDAHLDKAILTDPSTALIGATTVGGMCLTDELYHDAHKNATGSEYLSEYDCASINIFLQDRFAMKGIVNTINTACSSSANAIMYGARLIKNGLAKRAIVGGVDSLAKFTINGFNALHILSSKTCMPFDRDRTGLNLGEGAAFLVLEKEEDIHARKVYAGLVGYCNANDAYHPSSLSDEGNGPYLAMQGALDHAGLEAAQISFINAHGTATENNDLVESRAMIRVFKTPPPFASTKSNIGHTLGAAGAIEAVYSVLNLSHGEVYPGLNFTHPMDGPGLIPVRSYTNIPAEYIMSNSFGFGGNCSSLIFSKA